MGKLRISASQDFCQGSTFINNSNCGKLEWEVSEMFTYIVSVCCLELQQVSDLLWSTYFYKIWEIFWKINFISVQ